MATFPVVTLNSSAWTLIYDPAVSGDFDGGISRNGGSLAFIRVDTSLPSPTLGGVQVQSALAITISASSGTKIYGRSLTDSSYVQMVGEIYPDSFPAGAFVGLRALTIQTYNEANVKNGVQYEISNNVPALANAGTIDTIFITGPLPVIIKTRIVKFNNISLLTQVFRAPTYTGGTPATYYNLNNRNPVAGGVTILSGATITVAGTEFGAPTYDIGTAGQGNTTVSTFSTFGQERLLNPNTTYMLRITNDSGSTQRVSSYLSWYEGSTDLPQAGS